KIVKKSKEEFELAQKKAERVIKKDLVEKIKQSYEISGNCCKVISFLDLSPLKLDTLRLPDYITFRKTLKSGGDDLKCLRTASPIRSHPAKSSSCKAASFDKCSRPASPI